MTKREAQLAALDADHAFFVELVRVYGPKRAGDMRYAKTHSDERLVVAMNAKLAADEVWRKL